MKLVLVDDEKVVLDGISKVLGRDPSIEVAGTALDGISGLELILRTRPDVVLSDIRMPGMNGLEMIEEAQKSIPDIVFIVFSGFNEFKYAQRAIGLGVIDYMEKPITVRHLRDVLKRAEEIIEYRRNYKALKEKSAEADRALVEKAILRLFEEPWSHEQENMKQLLKAGDYLSATFEICVMKAVGGSKKEMSMEHYRNLVDCMTFDLIQEHNIEVYTLAVGKDLTFIFLNMECQKFGFIERAQYEKKQLEESGIRCYIGVSRCHDSVYELKNANTEAATALNYAVFLENTDAVSIENVEYEKTIPPDLAENQASLEFEFRLGNFGQCRQQISAYLDYLKHLGLEPEMLRQECLEIIYLLEKLAQETEKIDFAQLIGIPHADIMQCATAEETVKYTMSRTEQILEEVNRIIRNRQENPIQKVKDYIQLHYAESITLQKLADYVNMNPTYLSMNFKKEEGVTYIHYLGQIRMEQAMRLLKEGYKAKEVCQMVGYFDYKYFSKQFKTFSGMSPIGYKKDILKIADANE